MLKNKTGWWLEVVFLVWREDLALTIIDPVLSTWLSVRFWKGFSFRESVYSGWWTNFRKNWREIQQEAASCLQSSDRCIVIVVVFYMFEKCVFTIAYKRYINLKLLLFACYLKLSTNGGKKKLLSVNAV